MFYPWKVLPLGNPVEFDSGGRCEDDQMGGPSTEVPMERVKDPLGEWDPLVLIEIVMGPSEGWVCMLSERFLEEVKIK
jgi:hypothetical protein